jgi:hypothetical protein
MNLKRRHLDTSQRAMIADKLIPLFKDEALQRMRAGRASDPRSNSSQGRARDQTARLLNVASSSVESACKVHRQGAPALIDSVNAGQVSVSAAALVAELPHEEQEKTLAAGPKRVKERARAAREAKKGSKNKQNKRAGKGRGKKASAPPVATTVEIPRNPVKLADALLSFLTPTEAATLLQDTLQLVLAHATNEGEPHAEPPPVASTEAEPLVA